MRIGALVAFCLYATISETAQQALSVCQRIEAVDSRIAIQKAVVEIQLTRYTERHPELVAAQQTLAGLESIRAAYVEEAKSKGQPCTSLMQPAAPKASSDKAANAVSKR
jgi:hypothetical protein